MTVSVITVVKDHASGLVETQASLLGQNTADWEMIIVIGTSRDGSLVAARELQTGDPRIRVIEQESAGIYGAMNEGLEAANGEFIWFMNAGDKFATSSVLSHAVTEISRCGKGLVIGGYQIDSGGTNQTYSFPTKNIALPDFAFSRRGGCHQAMIFRTQVLKELGGFNPSYSLASDFELVLKVIKHAAAKRVSEIYASVEPGGRADQGIFLVHQQKHQIRRDLLGGPNIFIASLLWTGLARAKITWRRAFKK